MSRTSHAAARAEAVFGDYLALGPTRSLKKLASELRSNYGDEAPTLRTVENWSANYGWDRRAKLFDRDEAERAKYQLLIHRAGLLEERRSIQLDHAMLLHTTFRDGMTMLEHRTEVAEDGSITQEWDERVPIPADHIPVARGYFYMAAEKQATAIEHLVLGTAATERDVYEEQMGQEGPAITVLGPEAMQELGLKVGKLVRQLAKTTEARRAERELEIIDQEPEDEEFESAGDANLEWEEVTDDDE